MCVCVGVCVCVCVCECPCVSVCACARVSLCLALLQMKTLSVISSYQSPPGNPRSEVYVLQDETLSETANRVHKYINFSRTRRWAVGSLWTNSLATFIL